MTNKPQFKHINSKANTRRIHLFHYTDEQEAMIERAKKEAEAYMETFGKGREPIMINHDNYY